MKFSSIVGHAEELVELVLQQHSTATRQVVSRYVRDRSYLGSRDRRQLTDLTYAGLRSLIRYQYALHGDFDVETCNPSTAARETLLLHLIESGQRDLPEAAADLGVDVAAGVSLRNRFTSNLEVLASNDQVTRLAVEHSIGRSIVNRIGGLLPNEESSALLRSCGERSPMTIRLDRRRMDPGSLQEDLARHGAVAEPCSFAPDGFHISGRVNLHEVDAYRSGAIHVQDEGSQLICCVAQPRAGDTILDACAGAGGKSLYLALLVGEEGNVVAYDKVAHRLKKAVPRLRRSELTNVMLEFDTSKLAGHGDANGQFNIVLVDAPCTASGTIRRDPALRYTISEDVVDRFVRVQDELLDTYRSFVAPGGVLVYATCSFFVEENEDRVASFLNRHSDEGWKVDVPAWNPDVINPATGFMRTYPHRHGCDGFFCARLRRLA